MINRILLLSAFVICFVTTTIAQDYTEANLLIDYEGISATETLTAETQDMLQAMLGNIPEGEEIVHIELKAHGESRDIGENRLEPFVQFFEKQGIGSDKLELVTHVDDKNLVHLKIRSSLKKIVPINKEEETEKETEKEIVDVSVEIPAVKKVYNVGASKEAEVFSISPSSNVEIEGKEGTIVTIKREDLVYPDGEAVLERIKVELKEFYTAKDILLAELHTMEGDKVLETGGMLNLKITAQGEPLKLKSGKSANIKMPTKSAKNKKGMGLYFGKKMANGAVDWRLEERFESIGSVASNETPEIDADAEFNPNSYLQIKTYPVVDSVTTIKVPVNPRSVITGNKRGYTRKSTYHSHEEEYFDLELPYLNPNIVDGVWINADKPIQDPLAPKPVDVLVQVNGVPNKGITADGQFISYTPRVALMLKSRAVFLRGNRVANNSKIQEQGIQFEEVPLNEEVVLVAFLDTGKELLFATESVTAKKNMEMPILILKPMSKVEFSDAMATVAN
jgi:hypothetical protein